jgi:6-phosphogluconolactonase
MFRTLLIGFALFAWTAIASAQTRLYVGTYTGGKMNSKGIYLFEMDPATGQLTNKGVAAETPNPSFLAIHPLQPLMYAVSEGGKQGAVAAFKIDDADGKLTYLNKDSSGGSGPCHLTTDKAGKHVFVANYGSGSVACLPIADGGKLGAPTSVIQHKGSSINPGNQQGPHAHSINLDPANKFAVAADLGTDYLYIYRFDPKAGTLTPNDPIGAKMTPGSGPRHFAFHPDGKHAFVINEIALTLTSFRYDADKGVLTEIETQPTVMKKEKFRGSTAEVVVHPNGKWVLGSNRTYDNIVVFKYDPATEKLTKVGNYGDTVKEPRNFVIDPTGKFVLVGNQNGHTITVFRLNQDTGELTRVGEPTPCPSPVCLRFRVK